MPFTTALVGRGEGSDSGRKFKYGTQTLGVKRGMFGFSKGSGKERCQSSTMVWVKKAALQSTWTGACVHEPARSMYVCSRPKLCVPSPFEEETKDGPQYCMPTFAPTHTTTGPTTSSLATDTLSQLAPCFRTCSTGAQPSARPLPESVAGLPDDCCRMISAPFRVSLRVGEFLEAPPSSTSALPPPLDPPSTARIKLSQQPIFWPCLANLESLVSAVSVWTSDVSGLDIKHLASGGLRVRIEWPTGAWVMESRTTICDVILTPRCSGASEQHTHHTHSATTTIRTLTGQHSCHMLTGSLSVIYPKALLARSPTTELRLHVEEKERARSGHRHNNVGCCVGQSLNHFRLCSKTYVKLAEKCSVAVEEVIVRRHTNIHGQSIWTSDV